MTTKNLQDIQFKNIKEGVRNYSVGTFFVGWPKKPSQDVFYKTIEGADYVVLAIDPKTNTIIGYITAISDGVLSAFIPFLEVDAEYQKLGIGHNLVKLMLEQIEGFYMIDLVCDKNLAGFYEEAGLTLWHAMIKRNYNNQSGSR